MKECLQPDGSDICRAPATEGETCVKHVPKPTRQQLLSIADKALSDSTSWANQGELFASQGKEMLANYCQSVSSSLRRIQEIISQN